MVLISDTQNNRDSDTKKFCYKYPHPAVTTDCCIFTFQNNELSVLLIRRGIEPFKGCWALPGGFLRMDETAEQGAARELREETGYVTDRIRQFKTYTQIDRDPRERVVTIAFYALVRMEAVRGGDDAVEARWFPISRMPSLCFDHQDIVSDALKAMQRDIYFEPIGFELLPTVFTMAELQKIIETITGEHYDRRNFYNKMRHTGFVTEVEEDIFPSIRDCSELSCDSPKEIDIINLDNFDSQLSDDENDFSVHIINKASCNSHNDEEQVKDYPINKRIIPRSSPILYRSEATKIKYSCLSDKDALPKTGRRRRSNVRYMFNSIAFLRRKNKKGSGPITY